MQEKIEKIANTFGLDNQLSQLMEECGELIVASNKYKRGIKHSEDSILEEISDVLIVIGQIKYLLGIKEEDIKMVQEYKLRRTLENIQNGKLCR